MPAFLSEPITTRYPASIISIAEAAQAPIRKRLVELEGMLEQRNDLLAECAKLLSEFPGHMDDATWERWVWTKNRLLSRLEAQR